MKNVVALIIKSAVIVVLLCAVTFGHWGQTANCIMIALMIVTIWLPAAWFPGHHQIRK